MTICIASVCQHKGKDIFVISTDHMINVGIGQFEHDIKKHRKINKETIAMLAGNALLFNELLQDIKKEHTFSQIKEIIHTNFINIKKKCIKKQLLSKFGLEEKNISELIRVPIVNPFIGKLLEQIAKFDLNTSILLVGFEKGKPQIAEIREEGYADFGDINFHAIGSGQTQAINTLLFQKQSKMDELKISIYNVYKAKRNAEVVPGVGRTTDMLILTLGDGCYELKNEDLEILSKIYAKELQLGRTSEDLNNLKILKIPRNKNDNI